MNLLSYGAGLQSTALLHMSLQGDAEPLDGVIFADTQYEPRWVYETVERSRQACQAAGVPFHIVTASNIKTDALNTEHRFASMPLYTIMDGQPGMLWRQCSYDYKIQPIRKLIRALMHCISRQEKIILWLGISWDEAQRMKDSRVKYIVHRFPLVEKRLRRSDCEAYLQKHNIPVPLKSSCLCCPYHDDKYWTMLRRDSPNEFADVVEFERDLRANGRDAIKGNVFFHRSLIPLEHIEHFHGELQYDMFADECDGVCGT